jgi:hypothetical protein
MSDDAPISYEALPTGTPVLAASGAELGTVAHVLADAHLDFFDGLVIRTRHGIRFVGRDSIDVITAARVTTTIATEDPAELPKPDGEPIYEVESLQATGDSITATLARLFGREHWTRTE